MKIQGDITMIRLCDMLREVLQNIRNILESGEYERLPEYLSERVKIMDKLQECKPDKSRLQETIRSLASLAKEERFLMKLADEKKGILQGEMNKFRAKRRAVVKYQNHSVYGVQP